MIWILFVLTKMDWNLVPKETAVGSDGSFSRWFIFNRDYWFFFQGGQRVVDSYKPSLGDGRAGIPTKSISLPRPFPSLHCTNTPGNLWWLPHSLLSCTFLLQAQAEVHGPGNVFQEPQWHTKKRIGRQCNVAKPSEWSAILPCWIPFGLQHLWCVKRRLSKPCPLCLSVPSHRAYLLHCRDERETESTHINQQVKKIIPDLWSTYQSLRRK